MTYCIHTCYMYPSVMNVNSDIYILGQAWGEIKQAASPYKTDLASNMS